MNPTFPWQVRPWQQLQQLRTSGRLGHALLFSGRVGTGVEQLAIRFAQQILCESADLEQQPCGACRSCHLLAAGNHPDLKMVQPAEEGKAIVIDQVREISSYYSLKAHYDAGKLVILNPADSMNRAAANALLKVLEEPPNQALLLLVAHQFSAIPMTVRSRCVRIPSDYVDAATAATWLSDTLPQLADEDAALALSQAGGAPLMARELVENGRSELESALLEALVEIQARRSHALAQAKHFADLPIRELLRMLTTLTWRLILAKFGRESYYENVDKPLDPNLQALGDRLNLKDLYAFLDLVFEMKSLVSRHSGIREIDIAETLWLGLADLAMGETTVKER